MKLSAAAAPIGIAHERLRDAVYEVVSNAIKFSPADKDVTVSGTVAEGRYRLDISDQGPGLKPEHRSDVGPFAQFERGKREQQGLGLGLAIARSTVKLAGGELELRDGRGGIGLSVIFDFPLPPADLSAPEE